jgi:Ca2+-binding EF-hand superfamily protein
VTSAFSDIWFFIDNDSNGFISPEEIRATFSRLDREPNGKIDRSSYQLNTDGDFLELCFESAIVSDSSDDDCSYSEDEWIVRKRRCPSLNHEQKLAKNDMFDLLDFDGDGKLNFYEFYTPYSD